MLDKNAQRPRGQRPREHGIIRRQWCGFHRFVAVLSCASLVISTMPTPVWAQAPAAAPATAPAAPAASQPASQADDTQQGYSAEQLDALLAPIALYPDSLLTQILMASTFPLQVVEAARWVADPTNKALTGDALAAALVPLSWDPSVKSLVPFPQVLAMMNGKLDWLQQLGYAVSVQQSAVMDSVQRLRSQAQAAGQLQSTPQQVVSTQDQAIVIAPAQPNVVYVPTYDPTLVYGAWPYPAYPPVYLPPPPGYYLGTALVAGLAFGVGVAIVGGLWGWATPYWRGGGFNVNVNRYNNINVNRPPIRNPGWRPPPQAGRPGGGYRPPPTGPVGRPERPAGLPANGIGRPSVSVPGGVVRPPAGMGPANRPGITPGGAARPGTAPAARPGERPAAPGSGVPRPAAPRPAAPRPAERPAARPAPAAPPAFGGFNDGRGAAQYQNRGSQSRQQVNQAPAARPQPSRPSAPARSAPARPQGGESRRR